MQRSDLRVCERRFVTSTLLELLAMMGSAGIYVSLRETNELFRAVLPLALLFAALGVAHKNSNELFSEKAHL